MMELDHRNGPAVWSRVYILLLFQFARWPRDVEAPAVLMAQAITYPQTSFTLMAQAITYPEASFTLMARAITYPQPSFALMAQGQSRGNLRQFLDTQPAAKSPAQVKGTFIKFPRGKLRQLLDTGAGAK